jgi:3-oxoacyl-[acyl-carrier protein] reductase
MLAGKIALVTGGSRGIGRAIAERLAREGAAVAVNYRSNKAAADEVVDAIRAAGGTAQALQADIGGPGESARMIDETVARLGALDILVNNAGLGILGPLQGTTEGEYDQVFAFTKAVFFAMKRCGEVMRDGGRIINVTTITTRSPTGQVAYAGSKSAIETFTRAFAHEVGIRGITVNAVLPGATATDMLPRDRWETAPNLTALRRLGQPEDIANAVAFLAGPEGGWVTSEIIGVSGGRTF